MRNPIVNRSKVELDETYAFVNAGLAQNPDLKLMLKDGEESFSLSRLDKIPEPDSLTALERDVRDRVPLVDIAQILVEIDARTGFSLEFSHVSEGDAHESNLSTSICAVLLSQACNIDLTEIARNDAPELSLHRLKWVEQNYLRADTIQAANKRLVDAHRRTRLAHIWGDGAMASADGLRFRVAVETINAGPNRKYFHNKRGLTFYNFVSNQFAHLSGVVIPGTIRDSLYILELVLQNTTSVSPVEITCDTHGSSDLVFALFWLLGYQFSPRLADIADSRFWRMDADTNYGMLNGIARHRVNAAIIEEHWEDILRVAASLKLGKVRPVDLVKMLQAAEKKTGLAKALTELGRIPKTIHMLYFIGDPEYRRALLTQLNKQESRHALSRRVFHGNHGEIRKRYREGQEDQLGALGLVVNMIVLWNTLYIEKVLERLKEEGSEPSTEDVKRVWPLIHKHIKFLGTFSFQLSEEIGEGKWRPLRDLRDLTAILAG